MSPIFVLRRPAARISRVVLTLRPISPAILSILDENGVALQDFSVLLGHESVMTTEKIYIRRNRTAKASTINVLNKAVKVS